MNSYTTVDYFKLFTVPLSFQSIALACYCCSCSVRCAKGVVLLLLLSLTPRPRFRNMKAEVSNYL